MLTARRNLLKTMAALVTLPLSKLVRASPQEFNLDLLEVKKLANEVDRQLGSVNTASPEYIRILRLETGEFDFAYVWKLTGISLRTNRSMVLKAKDWETAKQVGRTLKIRRKAGRLVLSKQVKNKLISIDRDAQ